MKDRSYEQILLKMIANDPSYIRLIKPKYLTESMWRLALDGEPSLFKYIKKPTLEICIYALKIEGMNLKYIVKKFPYYLSQELCWIAVSSSPGSILIVPQEFLNMRLIEYALDGDFSLIKQIDHPVRKIYLKRKIHENPSYIQYINNPSEELKCIAISEEPTTALYFDKLSEAMMDIIDEKYPEFRRDLPNYIRIINDRESMVKVGATSQEEHTEIG